MAIELVLTLAQETLAQLGEEARLREATVEEVLRRRLLEGIGEKYERPDGLDLLKDNGVHVMLDVTRAGVARAEARRAWR